MKLRGIVDSKRRYATYLRNQDRTAPPAPEGQLDPRFHTPTVGPEGTLICACGGIGYSPSAYARHLAGEPMRDAQEGVYITGPDDSWARERERRRADTAPPEQLEDVSEVQTDGDGNSWQPFVNEFQQRQLRCVAGPRAGEVMHAPPRALRPESAPHQLRIAEGVSSSITD